MVGLETNLLGFMIWDSILKVYVWFFSSAKPPVPSSGNVAELFQFAEDMIDYETRLFNRKVFNQQEKTNHALFLMVTRMFAYDVITAECTGYYNLTSENGL